MFGRKRRLVGKEPGRLSPFVIRKKQTGVVETYQLSQLRIVLLGESGSGKSSAGNTILGREAFQAGGGTAQSLRGKGEVEGRELSVIDTPGWGRSVEETPEAVRQELRRSLSLCPSGPHAFLLAVPVAWSLFTELQRQAAQEHLALLGDGVWKHTILLFTKADRLGKASVQQQVDRRGRDLQRLAEACGGRCHALSSRTTSAWDGQVTELLEKIERMVVANDGWHYKPQMLPPAAGEGGTQERAGNGEESLRLQLEEKEREVEEMRRRYKQKTQEQEEQQRSREEELKLTFEEQQRNREDELKLIFEEQQRNREEELKLTFEEQQRNREEELKLIFEEQQRNREEELKLTFEEQQRRREEELKLIFEEQQRNREEELKLTFEEQQRRREEELKLIFEEQQRSREEELKLIFEEQQRSREEELKLIFEEQQRNREEELKLIFEEQQRSREEELKLTFEEQQRNREEELKIIFEEQQRNREEELKLIFEEQQRNREEEFKVNVDGSRRTEEVLREEWRKREEHRRTVTKESVEKERRVLPVKGSRGNRTTKCTDLDTAAESLPGGGATESVDPKLRLAQTVEAKARSCRPRKPASEAIDSRPISSDMFHRAGLVHTGGRQVVGCHDDLPARGPLPIGMASVEPCLGKGAFGRLPAVLQLDNDVDQALGIGDQVLSYGNMGDGDCSGVLELSGGEAQAQVWQCDRGGSKHQGHGTAVTHSTAVTHRTAVTQRTAVTHSTAVTHGQTDGYTEMGNGGKEEKVEREEEQTQLQSEGGASSGEVQDERKKSEEQWKREREKPYLCPIAVAVGAVIGASAGVLRGAVGGAVGGAVAGAAVGAAVGAQLMSVLAVGRGAGHPE